MSNKTNIFKLKIVKSSKFYDGYYKVGSYIYVADQIFTDSDGYLSLWVICSLKKHYKRINLTPKDKRRYIHINNTNYSNYIRLQKLKTLL